MVLNREEEIVVSLVLNDPNIHHRIGLNKFKFARALSIMEFLETKQYLSLKQYGVLKRDILTEVKGQNLFPEMPFHYSLSDEYIEFPRRKYFNQFP